MCELARRIEAFIAEPQCERSYQGDFAIGFEMRRDTPSHFGPGIWFSDAAVRQILTHTVTSKTDVGAVLTQKQMQLVWEALSACDEYLDGRADVVDGAYGEPSPNREMQLGQLVGDAINALDRAMS